MINNIKQKIIYIYKLRPKFFNAVLISIFIVLFFALFMSRKEKGKDSFLPPATTPTPIDSSIPNDQYNNENLPFTFNENELYYINQITSNNGNVNGFSWNGDKNIYSTKTGIFEAGTNVPIINTPIDEIWWANSYNAVVKTGKTWNRFDYKTKQLMEIPVVLNNPSVDDKGERISDFKNNIVYVYNTTGYGSSQVKLEETVQKVFFVKNTKNIVVSTNYGARSYFYNIDENLKIIDKLASNDDYILNSVSPNGKLLILVLNNKLFISDFTSLNDESVFIEKSELVAGFRNDTDFVIIEKYKDRLGRTLDNIYLSNVSSKRFKLSDSKPMINRINTKVPIMFNGNKNIVSFGENKGKTWILSLKPNLYPTYSITGELVYSTIKPGSH